MIRFSPRSNSQDAPAGVVVFVFSADLAGQAAFNEFLAALVQSPAAPEPTAEPSQPKRPGNTQRSFQGS